MLQVNFNPSFAFHILSQTHAHPQRLMLFTTETMLSIVQSQSAFSGIPLHKQKAAPTKVFN